MDFIGKVIPQNSPDLYIVSKSIQTAKQKKRNPVPRVTRLVYDGIPEVDGDNYNAELTFQEWMQEWNNWMVVISYHPLEKGISKNRGT